MKKVVKILQQYAQADFSQRIYLFLQFPDLRDAFQEIERKGFPCSHDFAYSTEQHSKEQRSGCILFLRRISETKRLKESEWLSRVETSSQ